MVSRQHSQRSANSVCGTAPTPQTKRVGLQLALQALEGFLEEVEFLEGSLSESTPHAFLRQLSSLLVLEHPAPPTVHLCAISGVADKGQGSSGTLPTWAPLTQKRRVWVLFHLRVLQLLL